MIPYLRWAIIKAVWAMAGCTTVLAAYTDATPRFY